jgi:hypothetical protein
MAATAEELARRVGMDGKSLRRRLRAWAAEGHPVLAGHGHLDRWVFTELEADRLAADLRRGQWHDAPASGSSESTAPKPTIAVAVRDAAASLGDVFSAADLLREIQVARPDVQESSIRAHIQALTGNAPNRERNHPGLGESEPALFRIQPGQYRRWISDDGVGVAGEHGGLTATTPARATSPTPDGGADIILIGCVKSKQSAPLPARDLFASPLFSRRRSYAELSMRPWFILSAKHGLVEPDEILAPYDTYLPDQSAIYRTAWGEWAVARLEHLLGDLRGRVVHVHAGVAYVEPLRIPLARRDAILRHPVEGLAMGEQLAWYDALSVPPGHRTPAAEHSSRLDATSSAPAEDVDGLVAQLLSQSDAIRPSELARSRRPEWMAPGLYSWWVDASGAEELTDGLRAEVRPGLIYVGQAGATRWPSGKRSSNTLWGRLHGMHLGGRAKLSTFRRTLAVGLREPLQLDSEDDPRLSVWMERHLTVVVVPIEDGDALAPLEERVLARLDPPLNLRGRGHSVVRTNLSAGRRGWSELPEDP